MQYGKYFEIACEDRNALIRFYFYEDPDHRNVVDVEVSNGLHTVVITIPKSELLEVVKRATD